MPTPGSDQASARPDEGRLAACLGLRLENSIVRRLVALADGEVATFALFEGVLQALNRAHGWRPVEDGFRAVGGRITGRFKKKRPINGAKLRQLCEDLGIATSGQDRAAGDS